MAAFSLMRDKASDKGTVHTEKGIVDNFALEKADEICSEEKPCIISIPFFEDYRSMCWSLHWLPLCKYRGVLRDVWVCCYSSRHFVLCSVVDLGFFFFFKLCLY